MRRRTLQTVVFSLIASHGVRLRFPPRVDLRARRPAAIVLAAAMIVAAGTLGAQRRITPSEAEVQYQTANRSFAEAQYEDAYKQYNVVLSSGSGDLAAAALKGMIRSALRLSSFEIARREAETLKATTRSADMNAWRTRL